MLMPVSTVTGCGFVTEEVLGAPHHHMSLPDGDIGAALGAAVDLFRSVGGNLSDKPFLAGTPDFARPTVGQTSDIARRLVCRALVFVHSPLTRHQHSRRMRARGWFHPLRRWPRDSPPVIRLPEVIGLLPATITTVSVPDRPAEICYRIVAVPGHFATR